MSKTAITSLELAPPVGPFSQAVKIDGFLFFSGQVAKTRPLARWSRGHCARDGTRPPKPLGGSQGGGKSLNDVVRAGVFLTSMSDFAAMNGIYAKYFSQPFLLVRRSGPPRYRLGPASRSTSSSRPETAHGDLIAGILEAPIADTIVGIGALGGTIARVPSAQECPSGLRLAIPILRRLLRRSGLRVSGIGGEVRADAIDVAAVEAYGKGDQFDLILLATKAQDALEVAPHVVGLLAPEGVILPIQNAVLHRCLRTV